MPDLGWVWEVAHRFGFGRNRASGWPVVVVEVPGTLLTPGGGNTTGRRTRSSGGNTGGSCQCAQSRDRRRVVRDISVSGPRSVSGGNIGSVGPSAKSCRFRVSVCAVARAWSGRATVRVACESRRRARDFGHGRDGSLLGWGAISDLVGQAHG